MQSYVGMNLSKFPVREKSDRQIIDEYFAKTYTDDTFRIIGEVRSFFHLSVLESVCVKIQNPVLCKQKEFIFSLGIFK